ncbi:MAG: S1C family serine protease [Acidimicrobiales bacterium]
MPEPTTGRPTSPAEGNDRTTPLVIDPAGNGGAHRSGAAAFAPPSSPPSPSPSASPTERLSSEPMTTPIGQMPGTSPPRWPSGPVWPPPSDPSVAWRSPAPAGPPARYRPTTASVGAPVVPPTPAPAEMASTAGVDQTLLRTTPGWGWRALVAFLVGGMLTAGGFAVGLQSTGDETSAGGPDTSATTVTVPVRQPGPTLAPDEGAAENPAAFVAGALGPSVVQIETTYGIGSGVIYDDGLILTNHHVIDGETQVSVLLSDGRRLAGTVLGSEANVDIAVVSVGEGHDLPIAPLAADEDVVVGQTAIAIGSPFRLQQTVTEGIVSAVNRPVPNGDIYIAMIQTDAPINPGNSGGALADRSGRVIGINTAIQTGGTSNTNAGVGFAIPIDTAVGVADRIVAGLPIEAGFLGVRGGIPQDGSAGVEVIDVTPDTPASTAGIQLGDRIISVDGAPVTQFEELAGLVVAYPPGTTVTLELVRTGETLAVAVTLGTRP